MIYICDDITDTAVDDACLLKAFDFLPPHRRDKAMRYRQPHDRLLSVLAYLLLRYGVQKERGLVLTDDFDYTANGKPCLSRYPDLHFSLSHCRDAVAVAIGSAPLGIDVESVQRYDADVAAYCCNADELRQIASSANCAVKFIEIWTKKESVLKQADGAAPNTLKEMLTATNCCFQSVANERWVCTVCAATPLAFDVERVSVETLLPLH